MSDSNGLVRLTGLWKNTTRSGEEYFSGTLGGAKVLIFANDRRTSESQPSHILFVGRNENRDGGGERQADRAPARGAQSTRSGAPRAESSSTEQFRIEPGEIEAAELDAPF